MISKPTVSLIVPCRNEEQYIANFIESITKQDYPLELIEVVIADGMSEDNTRKIILENQKKYKKLKIKLVDNPKKITPVAFNVGIKNSTGDFVLPIGAHSKMPSNYISSCVKYLKEYPEADNVGGAIRTLPGSSGSTAKAISISLSHPFGTGNAKFRNRVTKPEWVDTVFGGCYRREIFEKIGYYNEKLVRSQDLELNLRLIRAGGKILIVPELEIDYYPKSTFKEILNYHFRCGFWATYAKKFTKVHYRLRQYLPMIVFILGFMLFLASFISIYFMILFVSLIIIYSILNLFFSIKISLKEKNLRLAPKLPLAFFLRHFVFGLGSLLGIVAIFKDFLLNRGIYLGGNKIV